MAPVDPKSREVHLHRTLWWSEDFQIYSCHSEVRISGKSPFSISADTTLGFVIFRTGNSRQCLVLSLAESSKPGLDPSCFLTLIRQKTAQLAFLLWFLSSWTRTNRHRLKSCLPQFWNLCNFEQFFYTSFLTCKWKQCMAFIYRKYEDEEFLQSA